jgi:hypothetical protein
MPCPLTRISIIRFCNCFYRFAVVQSQIFYSAGLIASLTGSISHRRPSVAMDMAFCFVRILLTHKGRSRGSAGVILLLRHPSSGKTWFFLRHPMALVMKKSQPRKLPVLSPSTKTLTELCGKTILRAKVSCAGQGPLVLVDGMLLIRDQKNLRCVLVAQGR